MILAIAYLLLILRQSVWGWACALVSTLIYTWLFWNVELVMESALNVYYMAMAVYGWMETPVAQAGALIEPYAITALTLAAMLLLGTAGQ